MKCVAAINNEILRYTSRKERGKRLEEICMYIFRACVVFVRLEKKYRIPHVCSAKVI